MPEAKVRLRRYLLKAKQANLNPYRTSVHFTLSTKLWNLACNDKSETSMGSLWTGGSKATKVHSFFLKVMLFGGLGASALPRISISWLSGWMNVSYLGLEQKFHKDFRVELWDQETWIGGRTSRWILSCKFMNWDPLGWKSPRPHLSPFSWTCSIQYLKKMKKLKKKPKILKARWAGRGSKVFSIY